jgi:hypothetical protein
MPVDNKCGKLEEAEVIEFTKYFVRSMKAVKIPWSLNVLDHYYDTKKSKLNGLPLARNKKKRSKINVAQVLQNIIDIT